MKSKKNSVQLSWSPTLIICQLLIYIIKKGKNYIKTGGHKTRPNQSTINQNNNRSNNSEPSNKIR